MELLLIHCLGLLWASVGSARQLVDQTADRLLAAALLAWGNIVATSLLLSLFHRLGDPAWFLGLSLLLAGLTCLVAARFRPEPAAAPAVIKPSPWPALVFVALILPLALACVRIGWSYRPNSPDDLALHLPRTLYYLGQNSLTHFDTADLRLVQLPFNHNLLQLFALIYCPPLQSLNFLNLLAWVVSGIAVHRLCRLCGAKSGPALLAGGLALSGLPVLAQALLATSELPAGAGMLCAAVFGLRWRQTRLTRDALLAGLAAGLALGSSLNLLFFIPPAIILAVRSARLRPGGAGAAKRAWLPALVPALLFGAPFAVINFFADFGWIGHLRHFVTTRPAAGSLPDFWSGLRPILWPPPPLTDLNESAVGLGCTGGLFLVCAFLVVLVVRKSAGIAAGFAWLGLGYLVSLLLARPGFSAAAGDFVPALLVLAPGLAAVVENIGGRSRPVRFGALGIILAVVVAAGLSASIYLLRNNRRPLAPLLNTALPAPKFPALPLLMEFRLSGQSRINVDSDGVNEPILPLLPLNGKARFTARDRIESGSYNLVSRSSLSRNAAYENLDRQSVYVLLSIPAKRTAGVEFLATIGAGAAARDYFGLGPQAGGQVLVNSNRTLLVTFSRMPGRGTETRIQLAGLNPADRMRLLVEAAYPGGDTTPVSVADFTADGEASVTLREPFGQLNVRALDADTGKETGRSVVSYETPAADHQPSIDPLQPTAPSSIFVTDLVLSRDLRGIVTDGFLPTEGPFPQWDLPSLRWAKQPVSSVRLAPVPGLARLQLSFGVRLHVRKKGVIEVIFNGRPVRRHRIDGQATWWDQTLELTPQPGENLLEFRDIPLDQEPDWQEYLDRYPDVMRHLVTNHIPLEEGAREHYEMHGKPEGRTVRMAEAPTPPPESYYFMFRNIRLEGFKNP